MNNVLITGVNGFQGAAFANEFNKRGYRVKGLITNPLNIQINDIIITKGNLNDTPKLINALQGTELVVFTMPLVFNDKIALSYVQNMTEAALKTGVKKIIFNTSFYVPDFRTGKSAFDLRYEAEKILEKSGIDTVFIRPRLFLDNLSAPWMINSIQDYQILPYPIGLDKEISWISIDQLATVVCDAAKRDEWINQKIEIGNEQISGLELAQLISNEVGEHITYIPVSIHDYEIQMQSYHGDFNAAAIADIYRYLMKNEQHFHVLGTRSNEIRLPKESYKKWVQSVEWKSLVLS